jgi:integrase
MGDRRQLGYRLTGAKVERDAGMLLASTASRSSHRWSSWLLARAARRPGRRRRRPPQARPQLLGHDLDGGSGAAVLSRPAALLEPAHDHQRPAPLPEGLRFYDLRHTCASLLIAQGASVKAVQAQLGHATASITLDTYGHLFPSEMDTLGDRLELVRDAAMGQRERTQHGPSHNRLGGTAGG